jgi:hypothetical protein
LRFLLLCTCTPDEWLSIWWRVGNQFTSGSWTNKGGFVIESQASYGAASMGLQVEANLADNEWIEFTAAPLGFMNGYWHIYNPSKPLLKCCSFNVSVSNL